MFFKRFMAVVLILAMLCSSFAFAEGDTGLLISQNPVAAETQPVLSQEEINKNATGFVDITVDAPYAAAVKKLVEFGIIAGYPDGTFKPEGEVTRAEMCKMINLTLGYTDIEGAAGFVDVTANNWYYAFALAAQKQGYVEGYEDKTFRGSNNITRQEVCAILNRLLKPMNLGIPVVINDAVANWARPHVEIIVQNFIMPLEANNTFRATENLKRHELATVLSNMAIGPVKQIDADIRFFVNGEQYGETQTIVVGNSAVAPADPTPPGSEYVFEGWRPIGTDGVVDVNSMVVVSDVDYEAVFARKLHDVNFFSRGALYDSRVVEHSAYVEAPENPEVKGYEFLGWALSEGGEPVKLSATRILENVDFYAVFEKTESESGGGGGAPAEETVYSVKFFVNGDLYDNQKLMKNDWPENPVDPMWEGYVFLGWSLEKNGEIVDPSSIRVTKNVTLYAVFEKEEEEEPEVYTVTFYVDGSKYDTQFVQDGETVSSITNPSKDGYTFKYWSKTEGGSEVKLGYYTVTSNTDFYAVFEKKVEEKKYYTVTFMFDGEEHDSVEVEEGKTAAAPAVPSKDGYNFKGWSKTAGGSVVSVSSVSITANTTFYAVFEKIEHTVTFYVDGAVYDRQTVGDKQSADAPAAPSKDGYTFEGWAESEDGETVNVGSVVITSHTSFYAVFKEKEPDIKTFIVSFVVDGKTVVSSEIAEGSEIKVPEDPEKANHNFVGWSKTPGGNVVTVDAVAKSAVTYYAVFEEIVKYTVTFYVDGRIYRQSTVVEGETTTAPSNPSVDGYNFLGWSMIEDGEIVNVGSVKINSDTSFHALLEEKEPEKIYYDVFFSVDGARYDAQSVIEGGYAEEPAEPEKKDYTFKGWSKTNGGAVVDVTEVVINAKTTFYAVFEKNPVYFEVVFIVDGDEYDVQEVLEGEYPEVPNDPVLDGYEFLGWSKTEGGSTVYPERTAVKADTVYYAVFQEAEEEIIYYNVAFWFDGDVLTFFEAVAGDTVKAPAIPELETGVSFLGWSLEDNGAESDIIEVSDIVIEDHTDFYAVLIKNPNDPELMEKLNRGYKQLSKIRATGLARDAINVIKECVEYVIADANSGEYIDKSYVSDHYGDYVDDVRIIVNETMTSKERSSFINTITNERNVDKDVQDFLIDYFDIDTEI